MKTLNVIGCGRLGQTLARLWSEHRVFRVQSILNRSLASGQQAAGFVGSGCAVAGFDALGRADLVMISTPDEAIEACCRRVVGAGLVGAGVIVFHCSGSLPSSVLEPANAAGALAASLHPVKSFADPKSAAATFAGTFCAIEGDAEACAILDDALRRLGASTFPVKPEFKTIYHAGTVVVSNYLVALVELGVRCFEKAGIPRQAALEVLHPIVAGTVQNIFALGPVQALTGPIARGEPSVVGRQCEALGEWDPLVQSIYQRLGLIAAELSAAQGSADAKALRAIVELLDRIDKGRHQIDHGQHVEYDDRSLQERFEELRARARSMGQNHL